MVAELLDSGIGNAKTGKEIARFFNCDIRHITAQIERERREGKPICASQSGETPGYYLAADNAELAQYCESLGHRAMELQETREALLKILKSGIKDNVIPMRPGTEV